MNGGWKSMKIRFKVGQRCPRFLQYRPEKSFQLFLIKFFIGPNPGAYINRERLNDFYAWQFRSDILVGAFLQFIN
jgi:hypothetical protein